MKLIEEGKEPSPQFYEQPELSAVESFYWDAFFHLSTERAIGMGLGPIPYSSVRNYAAELGIIGRDEFDYFLGIITALDHEYLALSNTSEKKDEMVPITDIEEQHRMFARLKARANNAPKAAMIKKR